MRIKYVLIIFCFIPLVTFSQGKYLSYDEIIFDTKIEENTVKSLLEDKGELIDGFLVLSPKDSASFKRWKAHYAKEINLLKGRKISKKINKDVKFIYDNLHGKFLRKYENLAFFDQIFENGVYNCVTAVALYAMAFDELGISYRIKETPTHVYIIADPDAAQLLIETTNPVSGFKTFSPGFREAFVAQLGMMKLVDQSEISSKGVSAVFDEYYFGGAELTLKELVGIQYYNLGVSLYDKRNYHDAWNALSKAQLFHSTEQLNSLLFASIANTISSTDYSDWEDIKMLPYLERFADFDVTKVNVIAEFKRMLSYVLVSNNDVEKAEKAFNYYMEKSTNEEIQEEVSFSYFYERAILAYNRAHYSNAFELSTKAYAAKPGNSRAENILMESFRMSYQNKSTEIALEKLDTLLTENPGLSKNNHLNTMRLNLYLTLMGENFHSKKPAIANSHMERFEKTISNNPEYHFDENILANAYSKAAVYYFNRGYSSKARSVIKNGLGYAPNNYQLKTRLRMINH